MKSIDLLGHAVSIEFCKGTVLDCGISHKTHVSGGGSLHYGRGAPVSKVTSQVVSETKVFLDTATGERSFTLVGEFDIRQGHEITVVLARRGKHHLAFAIINHALNRKRHRVGSAVAEELGIPLAFPKWRDALQNALVMIAAAALGWTLAGDGSGGFLAMVVAAASYAVWNALRTRRRIRQADMTLETLIDPL